MDFIVWVETRLAGKTLAIEEVARVDRCADGIAREDIGLSLAEGKCVVSQVQRKIVQTQIRILSLAKSLCMHCSAAQRVKDMRTADSNGVWKDQGHLSALYSAHLSWRPANCTLAAGSDKFVLSRYRPSAVDAPRN